ncbi:MAG: hypothetical protein QM753_06755 [Thermomicrobiales bacterium]
MKRQHFAKRHKVQNLPAGKWVDPLFRIGVIDRKRFYSDANGVLEAVLYCPVEFTPGGSQVDLIRVRLVREAHRGEPVDPTAYDERILAAPDGFGRLRFFYKGVAEKGRRYRWQVMYLGDGTAQLTGTHYADFERR